jgi:hypothetical protein
MKAVAIVGLMVILTGLATASVKADVLALWLFDEGSGNTAEDNTDNGSDGAITNATYVPGKYGTALKFDGDGYVDLGLPDSLLNGIEDAFTAEVWIKLDNKPPADHSTLILLQVDGPIAMGFTTSSGGGLYGYAGSSKIADDGPDRLPVGEWFHFAHTYDGSTQKLFFNGEEIATKEIVGDLIPSTNNWVIGAWSTMTQYFLEGVTLDEMRISNEALPGDKLGFFIEPAAVKSGGKLTTTWAGVKVSN